MDWLDLLAVQGSLKSFLQHHSSKASILWHSAFLIVQLSHLYMTTGKKKHSFDYMDLYWQTDVLAVQGTLKSLLQPHSSKASILRHSAFFIVHLSCPYMTTGKTYENYPTA